METEAGLRQQIISTQDAKQRIEKNILQIQRQISALEPERKREIAKVVAAAKQKFDTARASKISKVETIIAGQRAEIDSFLDTLPGLEKQEIAGKLELQAIYSKLEQIYPQEFIETYVSERRVEYEDDASAFKDYQVLEQLAARLNSGGRNSAESVYEKFNNILISIAEQANGASDPENQSGEGMKGELIVGGAIAAVLGLTTFFAPLLVLGFVVALAVTGAVRGYSARVCFDLLYSIRKFITAEYDQDIFEADKSQIMAGVDSFLEHVKTEYLEEINSNEFEFDVSEEQKISERYESNKRQLEGKIASMQTQVSEYARTLEIMQEQLEALVNEKEQKAKRVAELYLENVNLQSEWLQLILFDIDQSLQPKMIDNTKGNSIFLGEDVNKLQNFGKLYMYQMIMHMRSDFCSQLLLDYKYMGGSFLPFQNLPQASCRLCFSQEAIDSRIPVIADDMQARAYNILKSAPDLEHFNQMMAEYGSVGENYWVIHILGLESISDNIKFFLKNGPKVGYFFKIYLTVQEAEELGEDLPIDDFQQFVMIDDTFKNITKAEYLALFEDENSTKR